ncbi:unnamed protein product [Closterium sp. NIES-65]|nr:unnamed protein product [Closterium sp. NIES-65]
MARNMGIPPTFRCSIRLGAPCIAAPGREMAMRHRAEAASADMAAVRDAREKMPRLLTQLGVAPRDTFNLDETALWLSVLPRRTLQQRPHTRPQGLERSDWPSHSSVNADGSHAFRPLVISKAKRPHDFRPDYDPEALCYWRHNAKGWMTSPAPTTMQAVYDDADPVCREARRTARAACEMLIGYARGHPHHSARSVRSF